MYYGWLNDIIWVSIKIKEDVNNGLRLKGLYICLLVCKNPPQRGICGGGKKSGGMSGLLFRCSGFLLIDGVLFPIRQHL